MTGDLPADIETLADRLIDAVEHGQRQAGAYSSRRITALRGGFTPDEEQRWNAEYPHRDEREFTRANVAAALAAHPDDKSADMARAVTAQQVLHAAENSTVRAIADDAGCASGWLIRCVLAALDIGVKP